MLKSKAQGFGAWDLKTQETRFSFGVTDIKHTCSLPLLAHLWAGWYRRPVWPMEWVRWWRQQLRLRRRPQGSDLNSEAYRARWRTLKKPAFASGTPRVRSNYPPGNSMEQEASFSPAWTQRTLMPQFQANINSWEIWSCSHFAQTQKIKCQHLKLFCLFLTCIFCYQIISAHFRHF